MYPLTSPTKVLSPASSPASDRGGCPLASGWIQMMGGPEGDLEDRGERLGHLFPGSCPAGSPQVTVDWTCPSTQGPSSAKEPSPHSSTFGQSPSVAICLQVVKAAHGGHPGALNHPAYIRVNSPSIKLLSMSWFGSASFFCSDRDLYTCPPLHS